MLPLAAGIYSCPRGRCPRGSCPVTVRVTLSMGPEVGDLQIFSSTQLPTNLGRELYTATNFANPPPETPILNVLLTPLRR